MRKIKFLQQVCIQTIIILMKDKDFKHLRLENQICHRLYVASNALTRLYRPLLQEINLSYPQYVVMMALWEEDAISMGELSKRTLMDKGFLTTLIKKLEEDAILKLMTDDEDRRKKIIKLSKKGQRLKEKASSVPEKMLCSYELSKDFDFKKLMKLLDEVIHGTK